MAFSPWHSHEVTDGWCLNCSLRIPAEAVTQGKAYSHGSVFSLTPKGRIVPCRMDKSR